MHSCAIAAALLAMSCSVHSAAGAGCSGDGDRGGLLGLDRCDENEATGIYSRRNQKRLDTLVLGGTFALALWEGTQSPAGRTAWVALDSMATTAVVTQAMKLAFQRPRPTQNGDPDLWRQGSGNKSFPSGETAMIAAFVTPLISAWKDEQPAVWALAALPVYMGIARVRAQGHWTSDVLVGGGVGVAGGLLAVQRSSPLVLLPTGDGVFVGLRQRW